MRRLTGAWGLIAACATSLGHAQDDDVGSRFREFERFLGDLLSVARMRDDCLRRFPSRATDILAAYDKSSASVYPELLKLSDPIPAPADRPPANQGSSDEGWTSCVASLAASLDAFDAQHRSQQDEIKFFADNKDKVLAALGARNASTPRDVRSTTDALSIEGAKVRLVGETSFSVYASCTFLENLIAPRASADGTTNALRNEAAGRGGNTLIVTGTTTGAPSTPLVATVFRCN